MTTVPDKPVPPPDGLITANEVETLQNSVFPWQLTMRQASKGDLDARIHIGQIDDILVTREFWSRRIVASGASPEGYLAVSGSGTEKTFRWCNREIGPRRLLCGLDGADVDFATAESQQHWVLLVPQTAIIDYLGESTVERIRGRRSMECNPDLSRRLLALADQAVESTRHHEPAGPPGSSVQALRSDLMEAVAELISGNIETTTTTGVRKRHRICRSLLAHMRSLRRPTTVPELALAVGVDRRALERALQENLGLSPHKFVRIHRLNGLRRDLRSADPRLDSVTNLAMAWGFDELGRTAVDYRKLFGESPSVTLRRPHSTPGLRLADALADAS